jgi:putative membrane protein
VGAHRAARGVMLGEPWLRAWVLVWLALGVGCWRAPYPQDMWLQHVPTVCVLLAWPWALRRFPLSGTAISCLAAFLVLHVIGARWLYSNVPYDQWLQALWGTRMSETLGWQRNHYDRLVHFAFGFLWLRPLQEIVARHAGLPSRASLYVAVEFVLAASMLYEVFEWSLTLLLAGEAADAYNGQQGDAWDGQKDMALAAAGALVGALLLRDRHRRAPRIAQPGTHATPCQR